MANARKWCSLIPHSFHIYVVFIVSNCSIVKADRILLAGFFAFVRLINLKLTNFWYKDYYFIIIRIMTNLFALFYSLPSCSTMFYEFYSFFTATNFLYSYSFSKMLFLISAEIVLSWLTVFKPFKLYCFCI